MTKIILILIFFMHFMSKNMKSPPLNPIHGGHYTHTKKVPQLFP
jgi:hypothetical protein